MNDRPRTVILRFLAEPTDINFGGKVHGGIVMKWIDQAGYACAAGWSGQYCVTAYVGGIRFDQPVHIGNVVEVEATVVHTGRTSMHIEVDVRAGDPRNPEMSRTTQCLMVFVAVDMNGRPTPVQHWTPVTENDIAKSRYVQRMIELRKQIDGERERLDPK